MGEVGIDIDVLYPSSSKLLYGRGAEVRGSVNGMGGV